MMPNSPPLILTLKMDEFTFNDSDRLRQQHFPPERNFIPAHITLFHALPGEEMPAISQVLHDLCARTQRIPLQFSSLRFLGRGVAIAVDSPKLLDVRNSMAHDWNPWLTRQDQQTYRPHITLQNKVPAEAARQLYEQLSQDWQPKTGWGEGLLLWYYRGGLWELVEQFLFSA